MKIKITYEHIIEDDETSEKKVYIWTGEEGYLKLQCGLSLKEAEDVKDQLNKLI